MLRRNLRYTVCVSSECLRGNVRIYRDTMGAATARLFIHTDERSWTSIYNPRACCATAADGSG